VSLQVIGLLFVVCRIARETVIDMVMKVVVIWNCGRMDCVLVSCFQMLRQSLSRRDKGSRAEVVSGIQGVGKVDLNSGD
jgi:hypothetical protein